MTKPNKPVTEVLIKHKEHQNVIAFATMLAAIAKKLKENGEFTFVQGSEQTIVQPAQQLKIEYSYTKKGDKGASKKSFWDAPLRRGW